jgi:hypothetical protein
MGEAAKVDVYLGTDGRVVQLGAAGPCVLHFSWPEAAKVERTLAVEAGSLGQTCFTFPLSVGDFDRAFAQAAPRPGFVAFARELATRAHEGQKRWGGEPFLSHPEAVAQAVAIYGPEYEAAAWLHDIIEDTAVSARDLHDHQIAGKLPASVVLAVELLTRCENESYLDYVVALAANPIARRVKVADLEHNLSSCERAKHRGLVNQWQLARHILLRGI